jgi:hypothetical protein
MIKWGGFHLVKTDIGGKEKGTYFLVETGIGRGKWKFHV